MYVRLCILPHLACLNHAHCHASSHLGFSITSFVLVKILSTYSSSSLNKLGQSIQILLIGTYRRLIETAPASSDIELILTILKVQYKPCQENVFSTGRHLQLKFLFFKDVPSINLIATTRNFL